MSRTRAKCVFMPYAILGLSELVRNIDPHLTQQKRKREQLWIISAFASFFFLFFVFAWGWDYHYCDHSDCY